MRPRKLKKIWFEPSITYFKPQGVPLSALENVDLNYEELEAFRLSCLEKLDQKSAADKMEIHQSTFQRTLTRAKEKIADALVNGKSIKIQGGNYKMPNRDGTGPLGLGPRTGRQMGNCPGARPFGMGFGRGRGLGSGRSFGSRAYQNMDQEKEDLKAELERIKKRLEELENE